MRSSSRKSIIVVALSAIFLSACDPREFDTLRLKAPIQALAQPEDMDSSQYPTFVLPVEAPRGNAELLVTGTDNVALADFAFGPNGSLGVDTVTNDRFLFDGRPVGPLAFAAPLSKAPTGAPRFVAVTAADWQPLVVTLDSSEESFGVGALGSPLPIEVGALAVGDSRGTGEEDIVLVAGTQLFVYPGGRPEAAESCDLASTVGALAVGDGWIVAGQGAGSGNAWVVRPPYAADGGLCSDVTQLTGHSNAVGFGTTLVVADLEGDGSREILVAAPRERAVYFYSAHGDQVRPPKVFAGQSTALGTAMAMGILEGTRLLIVGDPGDPADETAPGTVLFYDPARDEDLTPLERPTTEVQRFGTQVGIVKFDGKDGRVDLLYVTAKAVDQRDPGAVYVYFWTRDSRSDPRTF